MKEVTPPSQIWVVMAPDDQGSVVGKFDTGGQKEPTAVQIPDDCIAVAVADRSSLANETIDKEASPYYEKLPDGGYVWVGL